MEIKFKNGSKIESIESENSKRSSPIRIKFGEWETTAQESYTEVDKKWFTLVLVSEIMVKIFSKNWEVKWENTKNHLIEIWQFRK